MKWTGLNELREEFLKFFESKGHKVFESAPLVPIDDDSLLLINSGMAPLKKYFTGALKVDGNRATSCQRCIRTPDIERVGKTSRHGTYFEMLGNFSFGDYFKKEATSWAYEFITDKLNLPLDRLWFSIYLDDDEAFDIWTKHVGVPADRIVRLGKEDNFWEIGTGPCGPCSEIYFDRGIEAGCGKESCAVGCDCDRFVEFWNLVFTQFDSDGAGNYTPLAKPNIDTGMGLERLACIMQGVDNLFEVDTMAKIMGHICKIAEIEYKKDEKKDVSLRVITDHIRSATFLIGDGVLPSNEGRGYVLRRLIRRAARHGRLLGIVKPFLYEVSKTVIEENKEAYKETASKAEYIEKVIKIEEEKFAKTVTGGLDMLRDIMDKLSKDGKVTISGDIAFKIYDTFGLPYDLVDEIAQEQGFEIDKEKFYSLMEEQRNRARENRKGASDAGWVEEIDISAFNAETTFIGYHRLECETKILDIINKGKLVSTATAGEHVAITLENSPFYVEGGGQVGDIGYIEGATARLRVIDTKKMGPINCCLCEIESGEIEDGEIVIAKVDKTRRAAIAKNHTAAHMLQAALRQVLGSHVHQAGSYVDEQRLRFDFTHFSAMTADEIVKVEEIVNNAIVAATAVTSIEMPHEEAVQKGAIALFSEKYGDIVRVVEIDGMSVEFCGGTHIDNTAKAGVFKIISESSVASGVRRIEATTGLSVLKMLNELEEKVNETADVLHANNADDLLPKAKQTVAENKNLSKELESLRAKLATSDLSDILANKKTVGKVSFVSAVLKGDANSLKMLADAIKERDSGIVIAVATSENILVAAGSDAVAAGIKSGDILKEIVKVTGGRGGGRAESAMGGVGDINKWNDGILAAEKFIEAI